MLTQLKSFLGAGSLSALLILVICTPVLADEAAEEKPSLYERLGGLMPISVVVNDLIDALVDDEELNRNPHIAESRERVPGPYLKYHVTAMLCQATGGPCEYGGRSMKESHAHLQITSANWDRMIAILREVLNKYEVPEAEQNEVVAIVATTKGDIVVTGN